MQLTINLHSKTWCNLHHLPIMKLTRIKCVRFTKLLDAISNDYHQSTPSDQFWCTTVSTSTMSLLEGMRLSLLEGLRLSLLDGMRLSLLANSCLNLFEGLRLSLLDGLRLSLLANSWMNLFESQRLASEEGKCSYSIHT